jgi:hypothetical protein
MIIYMVGSGCLYILKWFFYLEWLEKGQGVPGC